MIISENDVTTQSFILTLLHSTTKSCQIFLIIPEMYLLHISSAQRLTIHLDHHSLSRYFNGHITCLVTAGLKV